MCAFETTKKSFLLLHFYFSVAHKDISLCAETAEFVIIAGGMVQMTFKGPSQPQLLYDSMILLPGSRGGWGQNCSISSPLDAADATSTEVSWLPGFSRHQPVL